MSACELKRQAKLEHWRTQIIDCRSSGMSVKGWCAEHNISTKTYYRWEKEILRRQPRNLCPQSQHRSRLQLLQNSHRS